MKIGIAEAFRTYSATLNNVNWSVSAWNEKGELIVSLWAHHQLKDAPAGTLTFGDRFDRWSGHGNKEFRANVARAFETGAPVRLVLARTLEPERVQAGEDASNIQKTFGMRRDLVGRVTHADENNYVIEFRKAAA